MTELQRDTVRVEHYSTFTASELLDNTVCLPANSLALSWIPRNCKNKEYLENSEGNGNTRPSETPCWLCIVVIVMLCYVILQSIEWSLKTGLTVQSTSNLALSPLTFKNYLS